MVEFGKRIYLDNSDKNFISYTNPSVIFENTKYLFDGEKQELFYELFVFFFEKFHKPEHFSLTRLAISL